jgi:hypothetical protein
LNRTRAATNLWGLLIVLVESALHEALVVLS